MPAYVRSRIPRAHLQDPRYQSATFCGFSTEVVLRLVDREKWNSSDLWPKCGNCGSALTKFEKQRQKDRTDIKG